MAIVHVASSFENRDLCKRVMRLLEKNGHQIAYDWTIYDSARVLDAKRISDEDFHNAHVVIAILPAGRSTHIEIGRCMERGKPVIIYAPTKECLLNPKDGRRCSYYDHVAVKVTHEEAELVPLVRWQHARVGA